MFVCLFVLSLFIQHASRSDFMGFSSSFFLYHPDFLAASFVRRAEDVIKIQQVLKDNGGDGIHIISKIENQEGMENYEEILKVTDAVMVARGDLGMEVRLVSRVIFDGTLRWRLLPHTHGSYFIFTADSTGKGIFGSKDDDSFCKHCRQTRCHCYTNVGEHDYQPTPDSCRVLGCTFAPFPR